MKGSNRQRKWKLGKLTKQDAKTIKAEPDARAAGATRTGTQREKKRMQRGGEGRRKRAANSRGGGGPQRA